MRLRVPIDREFVIHGVTYKAGEEFDAPDKEGALWKATGLAEEAVPAARRGRPPRKDIEEKEPSLYERKDMRAED